MPKVKRPNPRGAAVADIAKAIRMMCDADAAEAKWLAKNVYAALVDEFTLVNLLDRKQKKFAQELITQAANLHLHRVVEVKVPLARPLMLEDYARLKRLMRPTALPDIHETVKQTYGDLIRETLERQSSFLSHIEGQD